MDLSLSGIGGRALNRLDKTGLLFLVLRDPITGELLPDSIGLSIADYDRIDPALRSIFFSDESTKRDDADIVTLALASALLNSSTMVGSESNGVALYAYATMTYAILQKACRALKSTWVQPTGPTAFSFTNAAGAELSTLTESDAIAVAGISVAVPFTVAGGEAQVNSGSWVTSGVVLADDTVKVRRTSSAEHETPENVVLDINGVKGAFTVTTRSLAAPLTAEILANGWQMQMTIPSAVVGGAYDIGTDAEPKVSMTVTSKSWTSAGVETTVQRTVYGKSVLRKPYPNQAVKDETTSGSDIVIKVVLNDYIYDNETVSAVAVAPGLHTDSGSGGTSAQNSALAAASITNSSEETYWQPLAMWLNHDRDWCKSNTYNVQMAIAHKHFKSGQPVRAVKFLATDLHGNSTSVVVSSMSKRDFSVTGLSAPVFSGDLDFSGLAQGDLVTIDAIIYPWVGDAFQVSVSGDAYPSPNLTIFKVLNDRTGAYGTAYAYVDGVGGGTPACSTDPATAAASPYATIALAAAGLQTYINSTFTRNNVSGGIIRLTAATHTHSTYSARAVGEIPLIVEAADPENKATTIYQDAGASLSNGLPDMIKIRNIKLRQTGSTYIFIGMGGTKTGDFICVLDGCTFDINGQTKYNAWVHAVGRGWLIDCDGDDCGQTTPFSTICKPWISIGSKTGSVRGCCYNAIGCQDSPAAYSAGLYNANNISPDGGFFGWNYIGSSAGNIVVVGDSGVISRGIATIGNVVESFNSSINSALSISINGEYAVRNILDIGNTIVGQRSNFLYNSTATMTQVKKGVCALSLHFEHNTKTDVFATNGSCVNNWGVAYKVGSHNYASIKGDSGLIGNTYGPGEWVGETPARGEIVGSQSTPLIVDFLDDNSGSGAGGGDYTPGVSTEIPNIPAGETAYPWDLYGRSIPTDGSAYVGAVQAAP